MEYKTYVEKKGNKLVTFNYTKETKKADLDKFLKDFPVYAPKTQKKANVKKG